MSRTDYKKQIVDALLRRRKRSRGRPPKEVHQTDDFLRAMLVLNLYTYDLPNAKFGNRRQKIHFLQALCHAIRQIPNDTLEKIEDVEYRKALIDLGNTFPAGDLEQSVSRGMKSYGGLLREIEEIANEKLAKK